MVAFIGFGEAGMAFAGPAVTLGYDKLTDNAATRAAKLCDFAKHGVRPCETLADAAGAASAVLSLVTADAALDVARDAARHLRPGALWLDMNSVAPGTKRAAADTIEAVQGRYVDVAILAPALPARHAVPVLLSGPHAEAAAELLAAIGFSNVRRVSGGVGAASTIKMIRSVMVKGLEALTTEWILAAEAAGIRAEAVAALNHSWPGTDWAAKADYNLERMMVHGTRRAAEMDEAVKTLDALGTGSAMTRGTVALQRSVGALGLSVAPTLDGKLDTLLAQPRDKAA